MLETLAVSLAVFMIPAAPLNSIMPETYSGYSEPTAYFEQVNEPIGTGTVYTPNGTAVEVEYYNEGVTADETDRLTYFVGSGEEFNGLYYNVRDEIVTLKDKNISRIGEPTTTYNCLAFAFYMYWENVPYNSSACFMRNANDYINDYSYYIVDEPQVNDIVCYYSNSGIINAGVVGYVNENEAKDPTDSRAFVKKLSKCNVKSMWLHYGLYQHRGDQCPFVGGYTLKSEFDLETVDVKYFRRHETHNFKAVKGSDNGNTHTEKCSDCGKTQTAKHEYTYSKKTTLGHTATCGCGKSEVQSHTWIPYNNPFITGSCVECKHCHFVKKLSGDEIIPIQPFSKLGLEFYNLKT